MMMMMVLMMMFVMMMMMTTMMMMMTIACARMHLVCICKSVCRVLCPAAVRDVADVVM